MANPLPPTPLQLRPGDLNSPGGLGALNAFLRQTQGVLASTATDLVWADSKQRAASVATVTVTSAPRWNTISAFTNSWTAFQTVQWTKLTSGLVVVRGAVHSGTINTVAFALPITDAEVQINVPTQAVANNTSAKILIPAGTGNVTPYSGTDVSYFSCAFSYMASDQTPPNGLAAPVTFSHGLPKTCTDLLVSQVLKSDGTVSVTGVSAPDWKDNGDGTVTVSNIAGLPLGGSTYTLRLVCVGSA